MNLNIGTNPCPHDDWSLPIFRDLRLNLRAFGSPDTPWDYSAYVRQSQGANGYPTVSFGGYSDCKIGPGGDYTVSFTGSGQFSCSMGMQLVETQAPNKFHVRVAPATPIAFKVLNPKGFDNLTIMPVNDGGSGSFTSQYLDSFKPFAGPIRCMDLQRTNNSKQVKWTDRALPGHCQTVEIPDQPVAANYMARGVALEYLIELANTVNRPLWLCIPHLADDSWLDGLEDLLGKYYALVTVWIEWGNELWNGNFRQYGELSAAASAAGKGLYDFVIARLRTAIAKLRARGWAAAVLCGQESNPGLLRDALKANPDAPQFIGALATANYFLGDTPAAMTDWVTKSIADVAAHRALADEFKIPDLFAYEGGQYVTGAGKESIQRDPQMGDQYRRLYSEGFKAGLTSACHYNHVGPWDGANGYWAAKTNYDDVTPKWTALVELAGGTVTPAPQPPLTPPDVPPVTPTPPVDPSQVAKIEVGSATVNSGMFSVRLPKGSTVDVTLSNGTARQFVVK